MKTTTNFQPGDIVRISNGYHANSNGLFFVESGKDGKYTLEPLTKAGKLRKASIQFWPLVSYCSDRMKNYEAKRHNEQFATIEAAPEVPTCYVAEYFREKEATARRRLANYEDRGPAWDYEAKLEKELIAEISAIVARFDPADVPAPEKPASIRIYWNGLRVEGKFKKYWLSPDSDSKAVTMYGVDYKNLPREYFEVTNGSDIMTDYFENDSAVIDEDHPLHKFIRYAALKGIATGHNYRNLTEAQAAEWEAMKDPGQPTEADAEAAKAYIIAKAEAAKRAKEEAERERQEADARRVEYERTEGAKFIKQTAEAYPIKKGAPVVTVLWSEHPAFYDWEDGELKLSVAAAEIILKHFDQTMHEAREAGRDQFGPVSWSYYKTKYQIDYTDPKTGSAGTFVDRYDLGDNCGGLCALIESYNGEAHPFCQLLREHTAGGLVTCVTVAPWIAEALQRRQEKAEREASNVFQLAEMLTDDQLIAAVFNVDPTDKDAEIIARFFIQELYKRDEQKAVETWKKWKSGEL